VMGAAYLLLGLLWLLLIFLSKENLLLTQKLIGAIIAIGFFENIFMWLSAFSYNNIGLTQLQYVILAAFLGALKRVSIRVLALIMCLGNQVILPQLSKQTRAFIAMVAFLYYATSCAGQVFRNVSEGNTEFIDLMFSFPTIILDTILFCWLFLVLYRTVTLLKEFRQAIKLQLYQRFTTLTTAAFILVSIWITVKIFASFSDDEDDWWTIWWLWDAYWSLFYFLVLVVGTYIWRPIKNNIDYWYYVNNDVQEVEQDPSLIDRTQPIIEAPDSSSDNEGYQMVELETIPQTTKT